ncbi:MAG TPA: M28 family peptidase [Thermoanaerobaculia bacterium]|nr:M28 family peptidase [Thermoanaerobaculia bacterium]
MLPNGRTRRAAALAVLLAVAALAALFLWWRGRRPFLDRWGADAGGLVSAERIGTQIEVLSAKPHRSGTPANAAVAAEVERRLASAGLKSWSDVHDADLWEPVSLSLAVAGPGGREIDLHERELPGDPSTRVAPNELPFLAYAPDARLEAPLVYAHFGSREDYETLRKAGVDPKGKVALVHAQGVCRGEKIAAAEAEGVAALLVYIEPKDQGIVKPAYPEGSGPNPAAVSRGTLLQYFRRPGDSRRAKEQGVDVLPKIPALAISAEAAETLLKEMTGPEPPKDWKGSLAAPYALGPGKVRVRLAVRGSTVRTKIRSILASIPGADAKAPQVLVMGHYDAWVNGAVDPGSGAAVVLESAEVLSSLARQGWKPARGILFALWDGEEWGMLGSTAWVEAHLGAAGLPVAAAINVDSAARANDFYASLTPGLLGVLDDVLSRVADPLSPGKTIRDSAGAPALPGFSSDLAPFIGFTAVPGVELGFGRWYGAYHTLYDTPAYVAKVADPGFIRCAALARAVVLFAGALATPRVFPFRFGEVAAFTERELREIRARYPGTTGWLPAALRPLDSHFSAFEAAAAAWDAYARSHSGSARDRARADGLAGLAIASLGSGGAFGRGCVLWGPSATTGCGATALPGVDDAVRRGDRPGVAREISRLATALSRARDYLVAGDMLGRGNASPRAARGPGPERY